MPQPIAPQARPREVTQRRSSLHELLDQMLDKYPQLESQLRVRLEAGLRATEQPETIAAACMMQITRHMNETIGLLRGPG